LAQARQRSSDRIASPLAVTLPSALDRLLPYAHVRSPVSRSKDDDEVAMERNCKLAAAPSR